MVKNSSNIFLQTLFFAIVWQFLLSLLYFNDLIYYNPLIELSDFLPNFLFIFFITLIFSSPLFSFFLISTIYIIGVIVYFYIRQNITIGQLENVRELFLIYSPTSFVLIFFFIIFFYFLFKICIKFNYLKQKIKLRFFFIGLYLILFGYIIYGTQYYFPKIKYHNTENFNKFATWKHGGQLYSIIYHYAESRNFKIILKNISGEISPLLKFSEKPKSKLILMILLESFVPRSEMEPFKFKPFLEQHGFDSIILESPAYGGLSAKTEFEILCGLPELQIFGDLTFNYLGGKNVNFCLPSVLSSHNYKTISLIGTDPHFHNSTNAYMSLGFNKIINKKNLVTDDYDGNHPSDATLYSKAIDEIIKNKDNSTFLYVFTSAGHSPYELNPLKRPRLTDDKYFDRVMYSENELINFLLKIQSLRIDTSIIIAGDHATNSSKLKRNKKLLKVWVKSNIFREKNDKSICSQYFEIPKFLTGQSCKSYDFKNKEIIGRSNNSILYNDYKDIILNLTKKSYK